MKSLILTLALSLGMTACGEKPTPIKRAEAEGAKAAVGGGVAIGDASRQFLTIETLAPGSGATERSYFGRTAFRPRALSAVTAPFSGRIASVVAEPGQKVKAGATLFTVESADAGGIRATLDQARIKVRVAEEGFARQNEMVKRGVGLELERFDAEMKVREARAELDRAERSAALVGAGHGTAIHVRAPVDGVVVSVKAAQGANVQAGGDALVEIGNPDGLWVVADVPEGEASRMAKAKSADVLIDALNVKVRAKVVGVAPRSDAETRRTPVYLELEKAPEDLRAGLLVRVNAALESSDAELWLPMTAVLVKEGSKRVVYVEERGRFVARPIEAGEERGGRVRVLSGLQPGDRVVTKGALLVDREAEQLL
ncbi:MAG TPA: efflux RND transporter periplasmic adaptor subunit [Burkholderiales bacterium]|nr:efflux RND transporter periplasmic adaptor subunit [Burkholderiales bacterium]